LLKNKLFPLQTKKPFVPNFMMLQSLIFDRVSLNPKYMTLYKTN